jgi:restriction system protein
MVDERCPDLIAAYGLLLDEINRAIQYNDACGSQAFLAHDHDAAARSLAYAKSLLALKADVAGLQSRVEEVARSLNVRAPDTLASAPAHVSADPVSDMPRPVPNRVHESWPMDDVKTPNEAYRIPILQALVELGGSARTATVLERVHELMSPFLNEYDHASLPSKKNVPRWRNTAEWARLAMRDEGLLAADSPYGTWEITDAGRRWLAAHSRH